MKEIIQDGHPVLRKKAEEVPIEDIFSKEIQNLIQDMHQSLASQRDGVALAAPQIGVSKRIFVVAPFIFENPEKEKLVYINPRILSRSSESSWKEEGCLSCRWKIGEVDRAEEVEIEAYDEKGQYFRRKASGLLAHIYQHETDHLEGILFIDKARNLRDMTDEEIRHAKGEDI